MNNLLIFILSVMIHYFNKTNEYQGPQDTLSSAVALFKEEGREPGEAIDLGCGTGNDTLYLLQQGWTVRTMDNEECAKDYLMRKVPSSWRKRVSFEACSFEKFVFSKALLVNASFCLEYCHPNEIKKVMERLTSNLLPGGRFCGHFLGKKDSWNGIPTMNFATKEILLNYFEGFEIEKMEEVEWDGTYLTGQKHWHVYKIVAKKRQTA